MQRILAGLDTEYGLLVEGRGAEDQIEDATALVRSLPDECFLGWDYRYESPRADLRGFKLKNLSYDPEDAKFDQGRSFGDPHEVRADRILPNGARFYNDHGHPEYATPECWSSHELAGHDAAGAAAVLRAAAAMSEQTGLAIGIYKNNTDFHGASYGTHESYLVPRAAGFEQLFRDLLPMMVVRQILVGAGKVGSETGSSANYQLSQRADFFVEAANAETLYRRPIFNTRDEAHADPSEWSRLHVICGDANMISSATARKVGLMKLALKLSLAGTAPVWKLKEPVKSIQGISRDESYEFRIPLEGKSWTTGQEILESTFAAAEATLDLEDEDQWVIETSRQLLEDLRGNWRRFRRSVDWAAKRSMLEQFMESEGSDWRDPSLRSFDLEYHNVDSAHGLHAALVEMDEVEREPEPVILNDYLLRGGKGARSFARGIAVSKFKRSLTKGCWRSITFGDDEIELPPNADYPARLADTESVEEFVAMLRGVL